MPEAALPAVKGYVRSVPIETQLSEYYRHIL